MKRLTTASSALPMLVAMLLQLSLLCWAPTALAAAPSELSKQVLALTNGRRAKVVWARVPPGGTRVEFVTGYWVKQKGSKEKFPVSIVGFDTDEGVERVIVKAPIGCNMPWITHDGSKVIFTDFDANTSYVVNWDGSGKRAIGQGKYRYATAYWYDPASGVEWIYYNLHYLQPGGHDGQLAVCDPSAVWKKKGDPCIVRRRLDGQGGFETVWDQSNCWYEFSLSADGKRAGGAFETWPNCQVADLTTGKLVKYGTGCVPNFAPDNSSRFFWFIGSHASIEFLDEGRKNQRTIPLNFPKSGLPGNEAWPIRWSSDVRFVSVSGPWVRHTNWAPANVQLGRFNASFGGFDSWVTLTNTPGFLDAEPYMWVEPLQGKDSPSSDAAAASSGTGESGSAVAEPPMPAVAPGTLFAWPNGNWRKEPAAAFDAGGTRLRDYILPDQGYAHLGSRYQMLIRQGGFLAPDAGAYIAQEVNKSGSFSLSLMLTPQRQRVDGHQQILSLGGEEETCLTLEQSGSSVRVTYRTQDGKPVFARVPLPTTDPVHLTVTASRGDFRAYVDGRMRAGRRVYGADKAPRQPGDWRGDTLVFGSDPKASEPWQGEIESVVILNRALDADGAMQVAEAAKAAFAAHKPPPQLRVKAKLMQRTAVIKPEVMTYSRGLALYEYEVQKVIEGEYKPRKIYVYHWALMDKQILPITKRPTGVVYELLLEPFDAHPQLQQDCQSNTLDADDIDLNYTLYLDVAR